MKEEKLRSLIAEQNRTVQQQKQLNKSQPRDVDQAIIAAAPTVVATEVDQVKQPKNKSARRHAALRRREHTEAKLRWAASQKLKPQFDISGFWNSM